MIDAIRVKFKTLRSQERYSSVVKPAAFLYRQLKQLKTLPSLPSVLRKLQSWKNSTAAGGPDVTTSALDAAFNNFNGVIRPLQNRSEIQQLLDQVKARKPKRILEIGTANGGTLFLFCQVAAADAVAISVDLPGGWFGGGYPAWKKLVYRDFVRPNQQLHLLRADSHSDETFARVKEILGDTKLDFMFIDGDHTYDGVKQDYLRYRELCAPDALIGFHDIVPNATDPDCEVPRFWNELRSPQTAEFVDDWNQPGAGIGVIFLKNCS